VVTDAHVPHAAAMSSQSNLAIQRSGLDLVTSGTLVRLEADSGTQLDEILV
jgi:hypothetical protein